MVVPTYHIFYVNYFFLGFIQVQTNKKSILMHHKFCVVDGPRAITRKNTLKAYAEKLNVHAHYTTSCVQPQLKSKEVRGFVMSGSLNWSTQAMVSNHESVIVTSHPNIVGKFEKEFESLWVETESVSKIKITSDSFVTLFAWITKKETNHYCPGGPATKLSMSTSQSVSGKRALYI